ncbi:MAG: T9SS type A sorting domain-containing protein [Bacteroidetes bacterium]|nr:T9SS type A sorting domain-containing protein [Bacteroidota bacterium]
MKKNCNRRRHRLSFVYMRFGAYILFICIFFTGRVWAQIDDASDPAAIDVAPLLKIIDTSHEGFGLYPNLNIGDIDGDGYEDMGFGCHNDTINAYTVIHYGGNKLFDKSSDSIVFGVPYACADFDGKDGKQDLITLIDGHPLFRKNFGHYPYFSQIRNTDSIFRQKADNSSPSLQTVFDYDEDGYSDFIVGGANPGPYFGIYSGGSFIYQTLFGSKVIYPNDSCILTTTIYNGAIIGKFGRSLNPMIVCRSTNRIGLFRHDLPFSQDTLLWLTDSGSIDAKVLYAMDITGDGVTDLLISDGMNVYIYPGNDNFGTYRLTKENAYYVIKSPAQLDLTYSLMKDFGGYMRNCGNLIGDGTPLLMVTGTVNDNFGDYVTYAFFYSGGKALDTYYDARYREFRSTDFTMDTLHFIDNTYRGAVVFQSTDGPTGENFLLYNGCTDIPRTPNPNLRIVEPASFATQLIHAFPSVAHQYVRILFSSLQTAGVLRIVNILGQEVERKALLPNNTEEYLPTSSYPNGVYVAELQTAGFTTKVKFVVDH